MAYKRTGLTLVLTWTCMSIIPTHVFAQSPPQAGAAPIAHWSTFDKNASACACHLFARDALQKEGLKILDDSGSVVLAGNNHVIAQVSCKPGERQMFVSAFSSDSTTAAWVRNNVREHIVKSSLFDTCP
jgi:hypothetical protein